MFTIKVGVVPGAIKEVVVEGTTAVAEVLGLAGLETSGYSIRLNGTNVTLEDVIEGDSTLLLSKMIKGNAPYTVKVGVVPGAITEYVFEGDTTVEAVLSQAGLTSNGYSIRLNGTNVDATSVLNGESTLLLSKMIKGNSPFTVKVGVVPGAINEYVFEGTTSIVDVLSQAGLTAEGHSIRLNGTVVDGTGTVSGDSTILLAKMIKGNK